MKNILSLIIVAALVVFAAQSSFAQDAGAKKKHSYVGVAGCGPCHANKATGDQIGLWKTTKHANAYNSLKTEEAENIAKKLGIEGGAVNSDRCLKCHAPAYKAEKELLGEKYKLEDGVQCETCHGPGSDYKPMAIMKDRDKAIMNGLLLQGNLEAYCTGCHNSESPTFVSFNAEEMWNKIKHPNPKKK